MFSLMFCTYWGNIWLANCPRDSIRLGDCFFGTARTHVFYYALHALGQYQASEFLLQDRIDSICLIAFYRHRCNIRQANSFCGIAQIYVCIVFDTRLDSSRLTSCCCGVARIHVSIAFYTHYYPANELHLRDRPNSFLLLYFTRITVPSDLRPVLWDRPNSNCLFCFTRI